MLQPHQFITDAAGNKTHVLLTIEQYQELIDRLLDLEDAEVVRERRSEMQPGIPLDQLKKQLGL